MLNQQEWEEVEHLVDGEYMSQVDDAWMEAALMGVKLALGIVNSTAPVAADLKDQAMRYLLKFGNLKQLPLSKPDKRTLFVMNYGENEVQAMEEDGEL